MSYGHISSFFTVLLFSPFYFPMFVFFNSCIIVMLNLQMFGPVFIFELENGVPDWLIVSRLEKLFLAKRGRKTCSVHTAFAVCILIR